MAIVGQHCVSSNDGVHVYADTLRHTAVGGPGGMQRPTKEGARSTIHNDKPQNMNVPRDRTRARGSPVAERVWGLWHPGCTPKTRRNSEQAAAREALTVGKAKEELD